MWAAGEYNLAVAVGRNTGSEGDVEARRVAENTSAGISVVILCGGG